MATAIARNVRVFVDKALGPTAVSAHLASEARRLRDEAIRSGQASQVYRTFVDGSEGRSEDAVRRVIQYRFSRMVQAVGYAIGYAMARSPRDSGEYQRAWLAVVNGKRWSGQAEDIPAGSTVIVVNPVPYARKVDVGGMRMSVPPQIVEATRQAVQRAYPGILAERDFVTLAPGLYPGAPYTLKKHGVASGLSFHKTKGFFQKHAPELSRRKDRAAGQALTYPALILRER
jgi:hypothetical protein